MSDKKNPFLEAMDINQDGELTAEEVQINKEITELHLREEKSHAQKQMSWTALGSMIVFTVVFFANCRRKSCCCIGGFVRTFLYWPSQHRRFLFWLPGLHVAQMKWLAYVDEFGFWRSISPQKTWQIPNHTIVREFKDRDSAERFVKKLKDKNVAKST